MLNNEAMGKKSNICNERALKEAANNSLQDFTSTVIAAATVGFLIGGISAPIALAIGGAAATISVGAINFGALTPLSSALGATVSETVAAISSPTGSTLLMAEGIAEWGIVRPVLYYYVNPKKLFYKDSEGLNPLGEKIQALHAIVNDKTTNIDIRREAKAEIDKLYNLELISRYGSPVLKRFVSGFKNQELTIEENQSKETPSVQSTVKSFEDLKNAYKGDEKGANSAILEVMKNTNHQTPYSETVGKWLEDIKTKSAKGEEVEGGIYQGIGCTATFIEGRGLEIDAVYENSPAEKLGLKVGDVIDKVGETDITNAENIDAIIAKIRAGEEFTLSDGTVKNIQNVKLTPTLIDSHNHTTLEESLKSKQDSAEPIKNDDTPLVTTIQASQSVSTQPSSENITETSSETTEDSQSTKPVEGNEQKDQSKIWNFLAKKIIRPTAGFTAVAILAPTFIAWHTLKSAFKVALTSVAIPAHLINFAIYRFNKRVNKIDTPESLNYTKEILENPTAVIDKGINSGFKTATETYANILNAKNNTASLQGLSQASTDDKKQEKSTNFKDVLLDAIRMMKGLSYEERKVVHEKTGQKTVFPKLFS
jgi:membrane-associated protease RseP (regulator of RpoE activity)